jgi:hypothetical protein
MPSTLSRPGRALFAVAAFAAAFASACDVSASQDLTGRWLHDENGESAELLLEHDQSTGKVNGTFIVLGKGARISGRADASALVIEHVGDVVASAENGTMVGAISGEQMLLTITQPGQDIVMLRLRRQPASDMPPGAVGSTEASNERSASPREATAMDDEPFSPSRPEEFVGSWEAVSDDGTTTETAEFELADGGVRGTLRSLERGYYSGRVTVNAEVTVRGSPRAGALDLRAWDAQTGSPQNAVAGRAVRRRDFLVLRIGDGETGYARPGVAIVRSADGSPEAANLAQAIAGRIYSASTQSSARGAFVGNRVRLSLCSDGNIAFDVSDLASTGGASGVDMGDATSRRGEWSVVLRAGTPVVRAQWTGTGSSYSLTRYFRVQPHKDGSGARVDGTDLPVTGSC